MIPGVPGLSMVWLGSFFEIKYDMITPAEVTLQKQLGSFFEIKYDMIPFDKTPGSWKLGSFFEIKYDMIFKSFKS